MNIIVTKDPPKDFYFLLEKLRQKRWPIESQKKYFPLSRLQANRWAVRNTSRDPNSPSYLDLIKNLKTKGERNCSEHLLTKCYDVFEYRASIAKKKHQLSSLVGVNKVNFNRATKSLLDALEITPRNSIITKRILKIQKRATTALAKYEEAKLNLDSFKKTNNCEEDSAEDSAEADSAEADPLF